MGPRRFFVRPEAVSADGLITVSGTEAEHMIRVLRMKEGYKAVILTGDGCERLSTVVRVTRGEVLLREESVTRADRRSVSLTLFAGNLKNGNLDLVVRKAVELGVDRIVPFVSARTDEKKFNRERAERIALEAAKQCGALFLSEVEEQISFKEVLDRVKNYDKTWFCYENETRSPLAKIAREEGRSFALIVGSEGGFTDEEAAAAVAAGAESVTLGRRILRAETADIVASAFALGALGELDHD
ncbi:MAG TPA: 16S rRNA (uracil(1498)-N(3))-methyltransferase [Candidatus Limadaptatus stercoripullorum]|uniref:Ribosomal RNA small subunit methyltransferase E n=1 Tax=Candidatus Limadaptatus stercoripullorum TaxID=2840846 RepID=A0A9D1N901_9FIRM|nr:16S rRNA (uracil(1498)-N(3))-methyltransferase [Candidatus Limadaptatus stercoripullorum]